MPLRDRELLRVINGSPGSGLIRHLEASARAKGVTFLLRHKMTNIIRESPTSGRVQGITASFGGKEVNIQARRGVIIATGGHSSNVEFRRMFDPRLPEEYQVAGEPWAKTERRRRDVGYGHRRIPVGHFEHRPTRLAAPSQRPDISAASTGIRI